MQKGERRSRGTPAGQQAPAAATAHRLPGAAAAAATTAAPLPPSAAASLNSVSWLLLAGVKPAASGLPPGTSMRALSAAEGRPDRPTRPELSGDMSKGEALPPTSALSPLLSRRERGFAAGEGMGGALGALGCTTGGAAWSSASSRCRMSVASEAMRSMCSAMAVPTGQGRPCCANQASAAAGGRRAGGAGRGKGGSTRQAGPPNRGKQSASQPGTPCRASFPGPAPHPHPLHRHHPWVPSLPGGG